MTSKLFGALAALLFAVGVSATARASDDRLMLNEATIEQLDGLAHVTPALAAAIVRLRSERGALHSIEELRILPGVGDDVLQSLRAGTWVDMKLALGATKVYTTPAEVLAEFAGEPAIGLVQTWAGDYAQVQPSTVTAWLRASRGFAALPQVRVEYRIKDDWNNGFRAYDLDGNTPTSNDIDTQNVLSDADIGQDRTILLRATWDLDRLVMSSEQIRVINEAQDVVKLRERVLGEVTRLYFERRRLQVDMLLNPRGDLMGQVKDELRLSEITASLDAYTGGHFSQAVASSGG